MNKRNRLRRIHIAASFAAFALIALFLVCSLWFEVTGNLQELALVKRRIAQGLLLLVPVMAITGITGFALAGKTPRGLAATKALRMKIIAANGILVLVPAALFLACRSSQLVFDDTFWIVQTLEYLAGITNLALIGLNFRDGLALGKFRRRAAQV